jgi:serine/threonine protein kinase
MNDQVFDDEFIEHLADSFAERIRKGEAPAVEEYVARYPEAAAMLHALLPVVALLERHPMATGDENDCSAEPSFITSAEIGDFTIVREVGRGGMGIVYEAKQQSLGRHVALKVLLQPALLNPKHLERFRFEACAAARLQHAHIVPVFGVGEFNGLHYYAMQFIRGRSLHEVVCALRDVDRDGKRGEPSSAIPDILTELPSWRRSSRDYYRHVARIGLQAAEAISYAHQEGVLHRDIKPSNLLLDAEGNIWVTDFGLAKLEGSEGLTETGDFVGTLRYMAPERLEGVLDRRSDIYGLGATLYELLTLRTFQESHSRGQLVNQVLHQLPKAPTKIDPTIPRDLETIILKATAKEPAARYRTAEEMAEDLSRYLADRTILARRSTAKERFLRWCRRNPGVASLTAAVTLVLVVGIIGTSLGLLHARQQRAEAMIARDDAVTARKAADREAQRADEQTKLASEKADALERMVSYVSAEYTLSQGRLADAYQQITSAIKSKPMWEYGRLLGAIVAEARKDWHPAARMFCEAVPRWGCFVGSGPKWLVVSAGDFVTVYSAVDGRQIGKSEIVADGGLTCSMGRDRLAVSTTRGQVAIYSLPELRARGICQMPDSVVAVRSDADGKHLAILDVKGTVRVFDDAAQQLAEHQFPLAKGYTRGISIDISPAGSAVLFDPVGQETEERSLWTWPTNKIRTFYLDANVLRLQSDDIVVGLVTPISASETSHLVWLDLNDSSVRTYTFQTILYAPETQLEGVAISKGVAGISLVSNDLISAFPTNTGKINKEPSSESDAQIDESTTHDSVARYHSLWPQRAESPKLLAFDAASQSLSRRSGNRGFRQNTILHSQATINHDADGELELRNGW